ncbi:MAG TPA: hypothetical protein VMV69_18095 [Pirellulales bacterium]|nr:hypothetical protein [Pirellulales bacterium]
MRTSHQTSNPHHKPSPPDSRNAEPNLPESWQVVIQCRDEDQQREVYERMTAEGFKCRVLVL